MLELRTAHHDSVRYPLGATPKTVVVISEPILDETATLEGNGVETRDGRIVFQPGAKVHQKTIRSEWGGPGIYVSTAIAKDGHTTFLYGNFGRDKVAEEAIETLETNGVNAVPEKTLGYSPKATVFLINASGGVSEDKYVVEKCPDGARIFSERRLLAAVRHHEEMAEIGQKGILRFFQPAFFWTRDRLTNTVPKIPRIDLAYLTSVRGDYSPVWEGALNFASRYNIPLAIQPGSYQYAEMSDLLLDALAKSDFYIANKAEAILMFNKINGADHEWVETKDLLLAFHKFGGRTREVMVTEGRDGFTTLDQEGTAYYSQAYGHKVVNPNGAGDNASGIYVSSRLHGFNNLTTNPRVGIAANRIVDQEGGLNQYTHEELSKAAGVADYPVGVYNIYEGIRSVHIPPTNLAKTQAA